MGVKAVIAAFGLAAVILAATVPDADARRPGYRYGPVGAPTGVLHGRRSGGHGIAGWVLFLAVFGGLWAVFSVLEESGDGLPPETRRLLKKQAKVARLLAPDLPCNRAVLERLAARFDVAELEHRARTDDPGLRRLWSEIEVQWREEVTARRARFQARSSTQTLGANGDA